MRDYAKRQKIDGHTLCEADIGFLSGLQACGIILRADSIAYNVRGSVVCVGID
jgi:hypothetical protein